MNLDLAHKNALVCGGTDGIGLATAKELALLGANVTLFARNKEKLEKSIEMLDKSKGQSHAYLLADFSDSQAVKETIDKHEGNFHILINNTGGPSGGPILDEEPLKFQQTFEQHLVNNQLLAQWLVPFMKRAHFGRIINIISVSVNQPIIGLGVSNTVRWAVAAWAKTLSKELSHTGITVNNVLPGYTLTGRLQQVNQMNAEKQGKSLEEIEAQMIASIPSGKIAEPEEVAAAAAFLASPVAISINGSNITVDGGLSASL
ncbi:SDR family oxidoreductase [Marinilongibacter aquaticus]|uniref:SDR family oxidoreductase n=1 Tax=Marinilongibacter aquaticus TaxID=2975157 RepID=UPI0021BD6E49|nr:SDR family oxidoreductase [Marinilongibacter aquaticus]UBM60631.1 SDR family oxidoreductase [Marinilongibacter aquaticus]